MLGRSEQRGEARAGIEPRPTEPVDRAGAGNQRGRLAVTDECVIFDSSGHARSVRQKSHLRRDRENVEP